MAALLTASRTILGGHSSGRSYAGPAWDTPPPVPLRSGAPSERTREYADKMLLAALQEAQSAVRYYDNKAQIVGAGYILALNLVLYFGALLPMRAPLGPLFFAIVWGVVLMPILQFGHVLYPSRKRAERQFLAKTSCDLEHDLFYVDPDAVADVKAFVGRTLKADWTSVVAAELLTISRARSIKQARFRRGLMMVVVSFIVLGGDQFVRSMSLTGIHHGPALTFSQRAVSSGASSLSKIPVAGRSR